jgi:hypothetical protein
MREELLARFPDLDVRFVRPGIDLRLWAGTSRAPADGVVRIGYPTTRRPSVSTLVTGIVQGIGARYGDRVRFEFVGWMPEGLERAPNATLTPHVDGYERYAAYASSRRWDIGMAPIAGTRFDSFKTDVKYREYGAMRTPGVYGAGPPYDDAVADGCHRRPRAAARRGVGRGAVRVDRRPRPSCAHRRGRVRRRDAHARPGDDRREARRGARRMSVPADTPRNAPCPCGSGKRYKHCHGLAAVVPAPVPSAAGRHADAPRARRAAGATPRRRRARVPRGARDPARRAGRAAHAGRAAARARRRGGGDRAHDARARPDRLARPVHADQPRDHPGRARRRDRCGRGRGDVGALRRDASRRGARRSVPRGRA